MAEVRFVKMLYNNIPYMRSDTFLMRQQQQQIAAQRFRSVFPKNVN